MGDVVMGVINTHNYSANHNSPANKAYVEAFKKANGGLRPNFMEATKAMEAVLFETVGEA